MIQAFSFIGPHLPLGRANRLQSEAQLLRGSKGLGKVFMSPDETMAWRAHIDGSCQRAAPWGPQLALRAFQEIEGGVSGSPARL
ncbi:hypothetical protein [Microvirga lotononidis]|uniref:hypothetical protein n=1 Tax=Microvirga lotononidis TaxID=864069 RepID=UPI0002E0DD07|nr:hypothetical protein [Microvirga lotononidis]WQO28544.1 hypothetical protein U0023_05525 [Microvirga lotononidis]